MTPGRPLPQQQAMNDRSLERSGMSFPMEGLLAVSTYVLGIAGVLVGKFAFGLGWAGREPACFFCRATELREARCRVVRDMVEL